MESTCHTASLGPGWPTLASARARYHPPLKIHLQGVPNKCPAAFRLEGSAAAGRGMILLGEGGVSRQAWLIFPEK